MVINALDAPAALLRNITRGGAFLNLGILDRNGRPAVGARVRVTADGRTQIGEQVAGGSYLTASAPGLWFGLGSVRAIDRIEIDWPWGKTESWTRPALPARGALPIKKGTGHPEP